MVSLVGNLGGRIDTFSKSKQESKDFKKDQEEIWNIVRKAIDAGHPCYTFGFGVPEYYVIYGYDDTGYYASGSGCDRGAGPIAWNVLGDNEIGWIDLHTVSPVPAADDKKIVKDALEFALDFAQNPGKWTFPQYKTGLAGYDIWIEALTEVQDNPLGAAFNAVAWYECRELGAQFLREASGRLNGATAKPLGEAIEHYEAVARQLKALTQIFPLPGAARMEDKQKRKKGITHLQNARDAEEYGLAALEKVAVALR